MYIVMISIFIYNNYALELSIVNLYQKKKKEMSLFIPKNGFIVIMVDYVNLNKIAYKKSNLSLLRMH